MVWIPAIAEAALATLAFFPFLKHRISVSRWLKKPIQYPEKVPKKSLMFLLPIWNEAKIIKQKLDNLSMNTEIACSLLVIDSASTDDSVSLVKDWIKQNDSKFQSIELIEMESRLGKTTAVHKALTHLENSNFDGLVLMTDADATISKGTIDRMYGWFSNQEIGAVGARAIRSQSTGEESQYRSMFEMIRQGESNQDSTPFLEGSCMMWRMNSLDLSLLNLNSNADDAQIATAVRLGGSRSIFDDKASFTDVAPPTIDGQRRQKVRRAQGLQKLLKDQKKNTKSRNTGHFRKIFKAQHYMHIYSPILALGVGVSALSRWLMVSLTGMPTGIDAAIHASLGAVELFCLTSWLCVRQGVRLPLLGKIGTILTGLEYLLIAQFNSIRGRSSHMWQQHSDTREIISKQK
jgi:cellulose synthase/poly-beta-1,6-N-acetylglucosamine synthase-like glycosyltransferase